jgi:hypothetical protein
MNVKRRFLVAAIAAAVIYTAIPARAFALPGQTIAQFTAWAAQRPALQHLQRSRNIVTGLPEFGLVTTSLSYLVHTDGRRIELENIGVGAGRGEPGTALFRRDGTGSGFAFFRSLYGPAVARDYRTARRVATLTAAQSGATKTFYRGKLYGYAVSGGFLTLETFASFERDLAQSRRCFAGTEGCRY